MKAGVAQIDICNEIGTNVERILSYLKSAASLEVDFLCFPECSLTGYRRDFHNIVWDEVAQAIDELQEAVIIEGITIAVGTPYVEGWSGRRDSNPRHPAWKAGTLPLSYSREIESILPQIL